MMSVVRRESVIVLHRIGATIVAEEYASPNDGTLYSFETKVPYCTHPASRMPG